MRLIGVQTPFFGPVGRPDPALDALIAAFRVGSVFRISPASGMEAKGFARFIKPLNIKKGDFVVNNDWGLGAAPEFGKVL